MNSMRALLGLLIVSGLLLGSCRKVPPTAAQPRGDYESFVGVASFGGSPMNVLVVISESADSSHAQNGSITYQSQTSTFSELSSDPSSDTLRFSYNRIGVNYRAWALDQVLGLEVHFTEPAGMVTFRLNRETGGHNMTGIWSGAMSSVLTPEQNVTLVMDQTGTVYSGSALVTFVEPWSFEISNGSTAGSSFQLSGTVHGSSVYPTAWQGNYVGFDTISGSWNAGGESEVDAGQFLFSRLFQ